MRGIVVPLLSLGLAAVLAPARAQDLNGAMARFAHLLGGSWTCVTRVPATGASAAHDDRSMAVFELAPGGAVHDHISAGDFSGDYYLGYDERSGEYWLTGADSLGTDLLLTSKDGTHYQGETSMKGMVMHDDATYADVTPDKTTSHEVFTRTGVTATFDTLCTR